MPPECLEIGWGNWIFDLLSPQAVQNSVPIVSRRRHELSNRFLPAAQPQTAEDPIAALRALPEQFAQVVLLADVHEFTYEEIQETLGISAVTLTSRLSRGGDEFACALSGAPSPPVQQLQLHDGLEESRGLQAAQ